MPASEAFCPAGISSFFQICDRDADGKPLTDPERIGARGGGFALARGVTSRVVARKSGRTRVRVTINSRSAQHAETTLFAIQQLLSAHGLTADVSVNTRTAVPISAGFGTSAAGTLAASLAVADALDLPVTLNELGRITHVAEVVNRTGLGTASALLCGGFVFVKEPGAPGFGLVDRLLFPQGHRLVCAYLGAIPTRDALRTANKEGLLARVALEAIQASPSLTTFLSESRKFGAKAGYETPRITRLISVMRSAGAVGAAQNMIGEAVHAAVENSKATKVVKAAKRAFPNAQVFSSKIDPRGVRLLNLNEKG